MKRSHRGWLRYAATGLLITLAFVAWPAGQANAALAKVTGIALKETASQIQLSIAATGPVGYQLRDVQPDWIVVDVLGAELGVPSGELPNDSVGLVKKVRVGQFAPGLARVVVELIQPVQFSMSTSADSTKIVLAIPTEVGGRPIPARSQLVKQLPVAQVPAAQPANPAGTAAPQAAAPAPQAPATPVTPLNSPKLINLELRNAEISDVLEALAKLVGANIVTDTEVKGAITVRLLGVTFADALQLILDPNGLGYLMVGNNILVAKREKLARPTLHQYTLTNISPSVFAANDLPLTGIKKEQVVADDGSNTLLVLGTADEQARVQDLLARVDLPTQRTETRVIKLNYMDSSTFVDLLGTKLPADVLKNVKVDKASNSVIVTANVAQLQFVDGLQQQVDNALSQVLIEAMVVEVPTEVTKNLGVAWQTTTTFTITSQGPTPTGQAQISITAPPIIAVLNTLIQENKSRLLANPRLAVRDGETATMNIGDKIPFQVVNAVGWPRSSSSTPA